MNSRKEVRATDANPTRSSKETTTANANPTRFNRYFG